MPVTRKPKTISPEDAARQNSIANQKPINNFGRVTKNRHVDQSAKKRKILDSVIIHTASSPIKDTTIPSDTTTKQEQTGADTQKTQSKKRARDAEQEVTTPQRKKLKNALPPTPAETPSKSASKLFERLLLDNSAPARSEDDAQDASTYDTPPLTPRAFKSLGSVQSNAELPHQLKELLQLFKTFLSSTSLSWTHNGLGAPIYISNLLPQITRNWRKRTVTERDVHTILGILGKNDTFELADNGEASLCIEMVESNNRPTGHLNQPELIQLFHDRLSALWTRWTTTAPSARSDIEGFMANIPDCEIITSQVAPSATARISRGTELLRDLKAGAAAARTAEVASRKSVVHTAAKSAQAVAARSNNLLDRILAKQAANLDRADGPSPEQFARLAALDRITDIVDILDVLAAGRPRASFSTKVLLSHLQNSLRNPISDAEGEKCLELMAAEVATNFVKIIRAGSVNAVVITRGGKPSPSELRVRLESARKAA